MTPEDLQRAEALLAARPEFAWLTGSKGVWFNVSQVAAGAGVARQTVDGWSERGLIPGAIYYEGVGWRMPRSGLLEYFAGLQRGQAQAG